MDHTVTHLPEFFGGFLNLEEYIKCQSTEDIPYRLDLHTQCSNKNNVLITNTKECLADRLLNK